MRRGLLFSLLFSCLALLPNRLFASWWTDLYMTELLMEEDGTLKVTETIQANFTQEAHHGIYRDIPLSFSVDGQDRDVQLTLLSVDDGEGHPYRYKESWGGGYYHVKIGDPNKTFTDVRPYRIVYEVKNWCLNREDHQELYWNAIGTEWLSPIQRGGAILVLHSAIDPEKAQVAVFTGSHGSGERDAAITRGSSKTTILTTRPLKPYEGLTLRISWPGHPVPLPSALATWWWRLSPYLLLLLPVVTFFFMLFRWRALGRDPRGRDTLVVQYQAPEGMTAGEAGTLIDETMDTRDLTASIVELAVGGYLEIHEIKQTLLFLSSTDYELIRKKESTAGLASHQSFLLEKLFSGKKSVKVSDLQCKFYQHIPTFGAKVYEELVQKGYFARNPDSVRTSYILIAFGVLMGGFLLLGLLIATVLDRPVGPWDIVAMVLNAVIVFWFGRHMPAKTLKGVEAKEKILGLEEYIQRAEAENLKYDEKKNVFESVLPYALALGLSSKWAKAFEGVFQNPPDWYHGSSPAGGWNAVVFTHSLNNACQSMGTGLSESPRSSGGGGGGSSGGGGGGGGGGAW